MLINVRKIIFLIILMSLSFAQTLQDLQKMKSEYEKMKNQKSAIFHLS